VRCSPNSNHRCLKESSLVECKRALREIKGIEFERYWRLAKARARCGLRRAVHNMGKRKSRACAVGILDLQPRCDGAEAEVAERSPFECPGRSHGHWRQDARDRVKNGWKCAVPITYSRSQLALHHFGERTSLLAGGSTFPCSILCSIRLLSILAELHCAVNRLKDWGRTASGM